MHENKILEIKVGITILIGIILLVLSIVWLKGITFKPNTFTASVIFDNTAGLQIGDPVTVSGMNVGKVTDIVLEDDSVLVLVSLSNSVLLKKDAAAVIGSVDFFGAKKIDLIPGKDSARLGVGKIYGAREPDLTELTSQLKEIAADVKGTLKRVDSVLIGVNSFVGDKSVIAGLKHAVHNLDSTTTLVKFMVEKSDGKIDSALTRFVTASRHFRNILEKTDIRMDTAFVNVGRITANVLGVTQSLDSIVNKVKKGEGNLGKLIYEDNLYTRLDHTTQQLDSLIAGIRKKGMSVNVNLFGN